MKIRGSLMIALFMIGILSCVVMPSANAEVFDIGEVVESDSYITPYTSGVHINGDDSVNATKIFDGNLSTGINYENTTMDQWFQLQFTYPIFVNNVTVKSSFGGSRSNFSLYMELDEQWVYQVQNVNEDIFINLNCSIDYLELVISEYGIGNYYFNDVIINYTPSASNLEELQVQINDLTQQISQLDNEINELNNTILQLESENAALRLEIENLSTEIETLESTEKEIIIEKDPDNDLVYAALGSGILGIIIALVAIILASRKLGEKEPSKIKEASEEEITPEEKE